MMSCGNCKNCEYWERYQISSNEKPNPYGNCVVITDGEGLAQIEWDCGSDLANTIEEEGNVLFSTHEDFGCTEFKQEEE